MRIGTFLCWLWGHKFSQINEHYETFNKREYIRSVKRLSDYCVRCGIKNNE